MGMFDNITPDPCHLPQEAQGVKEWQTKDTPKQFGYNYYITKDGILEFDDKKFKAVPKSKRTHDFHLLDVEPLGRRRCDFDGSINFYSVMGDFEFVAYFDAGRMFKIKQVHP